MPRSKVPARSQNVPAQANYRNYKSQLRDDFSQRCGYCDDWDRFYGGLAGYHVEHFAPQKLFPHLATIYGNLIYGCPICNRAKSNKWIGTDPDVSHNGSEGFVDPCDQAFDQNIDRDESGTFVALTPVGEYMIRNLKLHLERHRYIWAVQRLQEVRAQLGQVVQGIDQSSDLLGILTLMSEIQDRIDEYNDGIFGPAP